MRVHLSDAHDRAFPVNHTIATVCVGSAGKSNHQQSFKGIRSMMASSTYTDLFNFWALRDDVDGMQS